MKRLIPLIVSLACLSACNDDPITPERSALLEAPTVQGFTPAGATAPNLLSMSSEDQEAYQQAMMDFQIAVTNAAAGAETWQEAKQAVQQALTAAKASDAGLPLYQLETTAATHMLARAFQSGRASEATSSDVAFYTEMLIRNESPNAPLIADALTSLEGTWNDATVRSAASSTLAAAEHFAEIEAERHARNASAHTTDLVDRTEAGASLERGGAAIRRLEALVNE